MEYRTRFGSLASFEKGGVSVIADDPKNYAFSNIFDVASRARPFENVVVGKNLEYVLEVVRVEGTSEWRGCRHDQTALVMDGEVEFAFSTIEPKLDVDGDGSFALGRDPNGQRMGRVLANRGHLTLLPAGRAYRYSAVGPAVLLIQTIEGPDTTFSWSDICQVS